MLFCDFAKSSENGKADLLGVFDMMMPPSVPLVAPSFYVYAQLELDDEDEQRGFSDVNLLVQSGDQNLVDVKGRFQFSQIASMTSDPIKRQATIFINLQSVKFPEYGDYVVKLITDGQEMHTLPLRIVRPLVPLQNA